MTALEEAIGSLEDNGDRFHSEDWRSVVPEVESDAEEISDRLAGLKKALGY